MTHRPDPERIIKECEWAIARIEDYGSTTMTSRSFFADVAKLMKEQKAVVHPESSYEMKYITDCCCDLCGVQLIREDNFCRGCGRPIYWSK